MKEDKEDYSLGKIIETLSHKMEEYERRIIEKSELAKLSPRQLYYLDEIYHLVNPSLKELAEKIDVSKPSVTAVVDRFVQLGYVQRIQSDEDKRSFHIHLTNKGQELALLHDRIHYHFADKVTKILTKEDSNQLKKLLNKIIRGI
jgi:DNA-binding MarR family transcriptional regulator